MGNGKLFPTHQTAAEAVREHKAETGHEALALASPDGIRVSCNDCDAFEAESE